MWKISQMVCLGILAGMSVTDLLYRKVSGELLAAAGIGAVIFQNVMSGFLAVELQSDYVSLGSAD